MGICGSNSAKKKVKDSDISQEQTSNKNKVSGEKDIQSNLKEAQVKNESLSNENQISDWRKSLNSEWLTMLEDMGFSKNVREKALVMTGNNSQEDAINWIDLNCEKPGFEDELIVNKVSENNTQTQNKPLTQDQIKSRQKELIEKLKKDRAEKDRLLEIEQEKSRMKQGKELTKAKREQEDLDMKRHIEQMARERSKSKEEYNILLAKVEEDKRRRFGDKYVPPSQVKKTPEKIFEEIWEKMRKIYMGKSDVVRTCFDTILIYLGNIQKEPGNEKFQKINTNNSNFKRRVGDILDGNIILKNCGFGEANEEGFFVFDHDTPKELIQDWMIVLNERLLKQ